MTEDEARELVMSFSSATHDSAISGEWDTVEEMQTLEAEADALFEQVVRAIVPNIEVKVLVYNNTYHIMVNGKDVYWRIGIGPEYHDKTVAMFNSMAVIIVQAMNAIGLNPTLVTWQ